MTTMRWIIILLLLGFSVSRGNAEEIRLNTVGVRAGITDQSSVKFFSKYEAYAAFSLPWKWQFERGWSFATFIEINAGFVRSEQNAFIGSIGPGLFIRTPVKGVVIAAGIYPTYIGRSRFGRQNFGESFQFTSEIGVNLNFYRNWTIGYCFQHMSNGGISSKNPGLNTHMLELGYRF